MNLITFDNVLKNPYNYICDIFRNEFEDIADGTNIFRNIQLRDSNDEFSQYLSNIYTDYKVDLNFIRKSPFNQEEPNFIHTDEMMGDITCILYLNYSHPDDDGTTIYDENELPLLKMYSKYNRMIAFDSQVPHSRNIFKNFGKDQNARLIQVAFLKKE